MSIFDSIVNTGLVLFFNMLLFASRSKKVATGTRTWISWCMYACSWIRSWIRRCMYACHTGLVSSLSSLEQEGLLHWEARPYGAKRNWGKAKYGLPSSLMLLWSMATNRKMHSAEPLQAHLCIAATSISNRLGELQIQINPQDSAQHELISSPTHPTHK